MQKLFISTLLIGLCSCSSESPQHQFDSSDEVTVTVDPPNNEPSPIELTWVDSLMIDPIDLHAFLAKKRGANSGNGRAHDYYFEPDYEGIHYQYFLFQRIPGNYSESERFNSFTIDVYKKGREIGFYNDTSELLIGMRCRINDADLGVFDLVGQTKEALSTNLMDAIDFEEEFGYIIYGNNVLVAHLTNQKVDWFRYCRLNFPPVDFTEIPSDLKEFRSR